ncbi:MAG: hypothetical protein K0R03_1253 [Moraxellaceae bacterium]|jgi:uncharacterized protein|nr:hypothetical protein [Moraxellaceae bacterium]MDF3030695.1 hypothetical protein [Moraxellaceae bacterium]
MIPSSLLELDLTAPLQDPELSRLDELFLKLGERLIATHGEEVDCIRDVAEFDGFVLAVVSSPVAIAQEAWLPAVWGGITPPIESQAEAEEVFSLLLRHHNSLARLMERFPENYEPVFSYDSDEEGGEYESVDSWCVGFLRGMELAWESWMPAAELEPELFDTLQLFGTLEGLEERQTMAEDEVAELQDQMPDITRLLAALGREQRARTPTLRRAEPKVGRNDPCPCGSGKKYKQCCQP